MSITHRSRGIIAAGLLLFIVASAPAKYSGGTGEPNDPYQIATAADLIALGETPADYDKNFILTADIDLDPNLPGRKVFDKAVIAPYDPNHGSRSQFQGTPFSGVFDGNGCSISNLMITGKEYVGLFGQLGAGAKITHLRLRAVEVKGTDGFVGGLAGCNQGSITASNSTGAVTGYWCVGGLVGENQGSVTASYSVSTVTGSNHVGGLAGSNYYYIDVDDDVGALTSRNHASITASYSTGTVTGRKSIGGGKCIGGLVGNSRGSSSIVTSYSTAVVSGLAYVGGLVGWNDGSITRSYSTGGVRGDYDAGGLVGNGDGSVVNSVWDVETSGLSTSVGGLGLTTAEMMDPYWLGLNGFANEPNWILDAGRDYPRLAWEAARTIPQPRIDWLEGNGTPEEPYRIDTAEQLILLGRASALWDKHFILGADIDLDPNLVNGQVFAQAPIPVFTGLFDGKGHCISHLTIAGAGNLGLFGQLLSGAEVKDLRVVAVDITGSRSSVGGLVGANAGRVANCSSTGTIRGDKNVGGLVGSNHDGTIMNSYSTATVSGDWDVGGLVGSNLEGTIIDSYSKGVVSGWNGVGGLVGNNGGNITASYSTGTVSGTSSVGGLVGHHSSGVVTCSYSTAAVSGLDGVGGLIASNWGTVIQCYSAGTVSARSSPGGLISYNGPNYGSVTNCLWDIDASGQSTSAAGTGKTTAEMQVAATFLDAGWDFVGETANGTEDIWWIDEGKDYPRLWWEITEE